MVALVYHLSTREAEAERLRAERWSHMARHGSDVNLGCLSYCSNVGKRNHDQETLIKEAFNWGACLWLQRVSL